MKIKKEKHIIDCLCPPVYEIMIKEANSSVLFAKISSFN